MMLSRAWARATLRSGLNQRPCPSGPRSWRRPTARWTTSAAIGAPREKSATMPHMLNFPYLREPTPSAEPCVAHHRDVRQIGLPPGPKPPALRGPAPLVTLASLGVQEPP